LLRLAIFDGALAEASKLSKQAANLPATRLPPQQSRGFENTGKLL
jgi:hypothetical protein